MIMRIWHGVTDTAQSRDFFNFLMKTGVPWYRSLAGNRGVFVLRRVKEDQAEFFLLSLWDSADSVRRFTGPDIDGAVYSFSEDMNYLLELETRVAHYEILADIRAEEPVTQTN